MKQRHNPKRRRAQLAAVHALLDMLELPEKQQIHAEAKLYANLLTGALLRSLTVNTRVPKSLRRARALSIHVYPHENPGPREPDTKANKPAQIERRRLMTEREEDLIYDEYIRLDREGVSDSDIAKRLGTDLYIMRAVVARRARVRRAAYLQRIGREPPEAV